MRTDDINPNIVVNHQLNAWSVNVISIEALKHWWIQRGSRGAIASLGAPVIACCKSALSVALLRDFVYLLMDAHVEVSRDQRHLYILPATCYS